MSWAIFVRSWPYVVHHLDPLLLFAMVAGDAALPCAMVMVVAVHVTRR